jgi:hypothetical protein
MTFKPAIWHPIAIGLSVLNLVGLGAAVGASEPAHAAVHAVLALAFGLWARRLRQGPGEGQDQARLEMLEAEIDNLGRELSEAQERLDFAERVLAQPPDSRRADPER